MPSSPRQPTRIDWSQALAFYVGLGAAQRSLAAVHREFGVSEVTVQKHARGGRCRCCPVEGWAAIADREDEKVRRAALVRVAKPRMERIAQTALARSLIGDELVRRATDEAWLKSLESDDLRRYYRDLERNDRLDSGEATDLVAVSDVQRSLSALVRLAGSVAVSEASVDERKAMVEAGLAELQHSGGVGVAA